MPALENYRPLSFGIEEAHLSLRLEATRTFLTTRLVIRRLEPTPSGLVLHGASLPLLELEIDGQACSFEHQFVRPGEAELDAFLASLPSSPDTRPAFPSNTPIFLTPEALVIGFFPQRATLVTRTVLDPSSNKRLEGLYRSGDVLVTQCEPEGFRRLTWFLDRPDNLTRFEVHLEGSKAQYPVLLSNGEPCPAPPPVEAANHTCGWRDPFPKPSYLFAVVAGRFDVLEHLHHTPSGACVALKLFLPPGTKERGAFALQALCRALDWDETCYGLVYDLSRFHLVAIYDFNMGAMENKGLNIFNASCILADPRRSTDADYHRIEAIIGHEYFHNWSGNRVTCRDWFQLSLKEGLTVFREQQFMESRFDAICERLAEIRVIKGLQFTEDAGPLAHAVQPDHYEEINNCYTVTIYEKGAELIRMAQALLGEKAYYRGVAAYFRAYDGRAATIDDFLACLFEKTPLEWVLPFFWRWYKQIGTPQVAIELHPLGASGALNADAPGAPDTTPGERWRMVLTQVQPRGGEPVTLPLSFRFYRPDGVPLKGRLARRPGSEKAGLRVHEEEGSFEGLLTEKTASYDLVLDPIVPVVPLEAATSPVAFPVLAFNRGFLAPILWDCPQSSPAFLARWDEDPIGRCLAMEVWAKRLLCDAALADTGPDALPELEAFSAQFGAVLTDTKLSCGQKARLLTLPTLPDLGQVFERNLDYHRLEGGRVFLRRHLACAHASRLAELYDSVSGSGSFSPEVLYQRELRHVLLSYLGVLDSAWAQRAFARAGTMTETLSALDVLFRADPACPEGQSFYDTWRHDRLVLDKWFALHALHERHPELATLHKLWKHEAFETENPNKLYALLRSWSVHNPVSFQSPQAHRFLGDRICWIDRYNPSVASHLIEPLADWRRYKPDIQASMRAVLTQLKETLSREGRDKASRALMASCEVPGQGSDPS